MLLDLSMEQIGKMSLSDVTGILASIASGDNTAPTDTLTLLNIRYQEQIDIDSYNMANLTTQDIINLANRLIQQGLLTSDEVAAMLASKVDQSYVDTTVAAAVSNLIGTAPATLAVLSALAAAIQNDATLLENLAYVVRYDTNTQNLTSLQKQNVLTNIGAASIAQGNLADTAVQPSDLSAVATSGLYSDLTDTPNISTLISDAISPIQTGVDANTTAITSLTTELNDLETTVSNLPTGGSGTGDYNDLINKPILSAVALSNSYNDLDDKPVGGGSGGSPFQVIEWDPITIGDVAPLVFSPYYAAVVTETSVYSTEVNPDLVNVGGPGLDIEFAIAAATVSNSLSGTFTINNIRSDVYAPMMITFTSVMITNSNIVSILTGMGTDTTFGGAFQVINTTALSGNPQPTSFILRNGLTNSQPGTSLSNTETTITFNNGVLSTEDPSVNLTLDFSTYNIMTIIAFGDYLKVIGGVTPNPVIPVEFINNLTDTSVSTTDIPSEAVDGTVLKVIGHDGVLLGEEVLVGDECTLFNNLSEFLVDRPFEKGAELSLSNGLLSTSVPQVQTFLNTSGGLYMTAPVSFLTYTGDISGVSASILIGADVRYGRLTLINSKRTARGFWLGCAVPLKFVDQYGVEITESSYNDSSNYVYPDYREVINGILYQPPFTASTYSIVGDGSRVILKLESSSMTEGTSAMELVDSDITVVDDLDTDGIVSIVEQNETSTVRLRVNLDEDKKPGYLINISAFISTGYASLVIYNATGNIEIPFDAFTILSAQNITDGFIEFILHVDGVTENSTINILANISLSKSGSGTSNRLIGNPGGLSFVYEAPTVLPSTAIITGTPRIVYDGYFKIIDPDITRSDRIAYGLSGTLTTDVFFDWSVSGSWGSGDYPVAGNVINITSRVATVNNQTDEIIWGDYVQPIFDNTVNGVYTLTETDANNFSTTFPITISSLYENQFVKLSFDMYNSESEVYTSSPSADTREIILYFTANGTVLSSPVYGAAITNLDEVYDLVNSNYIIATDREYAELLSGETTSELKFGSNPTFVLGSKIVVTASVSDLPNSGFGDSLIAPPTIDGLDTYTITQNDVDNAYTVDTSFPITFSAPESNPYFVRLAVSTVDGTTNERLTADYWVYIIIYPLISEVNIINGDPDIENGAVSLQGYLTFEYPPQIAIGDRLYVSDDSYNTGTEAVSGLPFELVMDSNTIGAGILTITPYFPYNSGVNYSKEVYARIFRDNSTGVPIKGRPSTSTITVTF